MHAFDIATFSSVAISIFMIFNSYGVVPIFLALLSPYEHKKQQKIILRETIIALGILIAFIFFGAKILQVLGVTLSSLRIGGGVLLFLISLTLLFPKDASTKGMPLHEPFVVPLAIPLLAGPGCITAVMVFAAEHGWVMASSALFVAWIPSIIILLSANFIKNYFGEKGLQAIERLGGMVIALVGVQMVASGVVELVKMSFPVVIK